MQYAVRYVRGVTLNAGAAIANGDIVLLSSDDQRLDPIAADGTLALGIALSSASGDGVAVNVELFRDLKQFRLPLQSATYQDLNTARTSANALLVADSGTNSTAAQREALLLECFPVVGATGGYGIDLDDAADADSTCLFKLWELEKDEGSGRYWGWFTPALWWTGATVGDQALINVA